MGRPAAPTEAGGESSRVLPSGDRNRACRIARAGRRRPRADAAPAGSRRRDEAGVDRPENRRQPIDRRRAGGHGLPDDPGLPRQSWRRVLQLPTCIRGSGHRGGGRVRGLRDGLHRRAELRSLGDRLFGGSAGGGSGAGRRRKRLLSGGGSVTAGGVTLASVDGGPALVRDRPSTESAWVPLIPRTLCVALAGRELPEWFRSSAGLPDGAGLEGLRRVRAASDLNVRRERIRLNLCDLLAAGWSEVREVRVIDRPWPAGLDPRSVDWPTRVRRGLVTSGLIDDPRLALAVDLRSPGRSDRDRHALGLRFRRDRRGGRRSGLQRGRAAPGTHRACTARRQEHLGRSDQRSGIPRFRDLLGSDRRTLAERLERALGPASDLRPDDWLGLAWALPEIFDRVERIEQDPARASPSGSMSRGSTVSTAGRWTRSSPGWVSSGQPPCLLSVAASRTKLSPERIRVLQGRLEARLPSHPVYLPALDRALALLVGAAPCALGEGEALLRASGIATVPFRPESVLSAAWLCGRKAGFELEQKQPGGSEYVLDRTPQYGQLLVRVAAVQGGGVRSGKLDGADRRCSRPRNQRHGVTGSRRPRSPGRGRVPRRRLVLATETQPEPARDADPANPRPWPRRSTSTRFVPASPGPTGRGRPLSFLRSTFSERSIERILIFASIDTRAFARPVEPSRKAL